MEIREATDRTGYAGLMAANSAEINEIRREMLKFATLQLNDEHLAEDAVQEAMIGAMKNVDSFAGQSAFKTWVFAILRNKIRDILRKRQRLVTASSLLSPDPEDDDQDVDALFDQRGHWNHEDRPVKWGDPEQNFGQQQFWQIFELCLNNLPPSQARVFMMREYLGLETEHICTEVALSVSNLHVLLHRARMRLQKCLEMKWFVKGEDDEKL